jgi:hypothetical protein
MPQRITGLNINSDRPTVPRQYRDDVRAAIPALEADRSASLTLVVPKLPIVTGRNGSAPPSMDAGPVRIGPPGQKQAVTPPKSLPGTGRSRCRTIGPWKTTGVQDVVRYR